MLCMCQCYHLLLRDLQEFCVKISTQCHRNNHLPISFSSKLEERISLLSINTSAAYFLLITHFWKMSENNSPCILVVIYAAGGNNNHRILLRIHNDFLSRTTLEFWIESFYLIGCVYRFPKLFWIGHIGERNYAFLLPNALAWLTIFCCSSISSWIMKNILQCTEDIIHCRFCLLTLFTLTIILLWEASLVD